MRQQRWAEILAGLREAGKVEVVPLAERLGVSEMTVRRDLEALDERGVVRRVHGGAVPVPSRSYEPPYAMRAVRQSEAKQRIGKVCADLLDEGETVFLDVGTTTEAVAEALRGRRNLTIITSSLRVASILADEEQLRIICLGGTVRPGERSLVGFMTMQGMAELYPDVCVFGVGGIEVEAGLTEFSLEDAAVKRAAIKRGRRTLVVADQSKIGAVAFASIGPVSEVDVLVTDAPPNNEGLKALVSAGVVVQPAGALEVA